MQNEDRDIRVLQGTVKWFDPARGFGFVVSDGAERDILLHANVLRNYGQSSVADGAQITIRVESTEKGDQVMEVLDIGLPEGIALRPLEEMGLDPELAAKQPLQPARVKWFDKIKGFGFANVFGLRQDIFLHMEILRASGFSDLAAGEAVALRATEGRRGMTAVQVVSWEAALRESE
ncbi:cold-shock protein [Falsirhodobacter algicola]|uniref:Cold shock domain-containing protein n=1 Tax=Falsirhodobacter algicola TaxID=2692330 RepID=A0A8J8MRU3_9RHOB|nr:cold shock domain-containing protein [Falsirhodobacter algicola]QUS35211.1 cold shock domain-containing protein [Falsirhodobacter algicola]